MEKTIIRPKVLGRFEVRGRTSFTVESPGTYNRDKPEIIGELIEAEGQIWKVIAVERHLPATPIWPGEQIGLLVDPVEAP